MELSFGEIVLVVLIAFLVLGPQELVRRSRQIGQMMGKFRTEVNNFRILAEEQIMQEKPKKAPAIAEEAPVREGDDQDRNRS